MPHDLTGAWLDILGRDRAGAGGSAELLSSSYLSGAGKLSFRSSRMGGEASPDVAD